MQAVMGKLEKQERTEWTEEKQGGKELAMCQDTGQEVKSSQKLAAHIFNPCTWEAESGGTL